MSKDSRSGGKFTGNHTTLIPLASSVCDIVAACEHVNKITPGLIKAGLRSVNGQKRVKITEKDGGILLSIRDNTSHQLVYIYSHNITEAKFSLAKRLRNNNIGIRFTKPVD